MTRNRAKNWKKQIWNLLKDITQELLTHKNQGNMLVIIFHWPISIGCFCFLMMLLCKCNGKTFVRIPVCIILTTWSVCLPFVNHRKWKPFRTQSPHQLQKNIHNLKCKRDWPTTKVGVFVLLFVTQDKHKATC